MAAIIGDNPLRRLDMAPNFQLDADSLAGTGLAAFGMQGSGKTNVLMRRFGVTKYQAGLLRDRIVQAAPGH